MKAIISSTYDSKYLYFLPIVTWLWNKLGVDVICFMPEINDSKTYQKPALIVDTMGAQNLKFKIHTFSAPEHKEATYAQCSRLYAACLDLPEDEILISSDIDMGVFKILHTSDEFTIVGRDLVPDGQLPMCYLSGTVNQWRRIFELQYGVTSERLGSKMELKIKTHQECLDNLLGGIDAQEFRGNYWSKDQETARNQLNKIQSNGIYSVRYVPRAKPGTQFADNRVDRDDINWRSYLNENLIDAHLWRPGYTYENFPKIMELMTTMYHNEDFTWLVEYTQEYKKLINE